MRHPAPQEHAVSRRTGSMPMSCSRQGARLRARPGARQAGAARQARMAPHAASPGTLLTGEDAVSPAAPSVARPTSSTAPAAAAAAAQPQQPQPHHPQQEQQQHQQLQHQQQQQQQPPPLQVTRDNFARALPALRDALAECEFFAFDCEMTGLYPVGQEDALLDDVDDRYAKTVASAQSFLITQLGVSAFSWVHAPPPGAAAGGGAAEQPAPPSGGGHWRARSFNIWLFPMPFDDYDHRFQCQSSSMAFLSSQGFDFNTWVGRGVPFLPLSWRDRKLAEAREQRKRQVARVDMDELDEDERMYAEQLLAQVNAWLKATPVPAAADASADAAADGVGGVPAGGESLGAAHVLHLPRAPPPYERLQQRLLASWPFQTEDPPGFVVGGDPELADAGGGGGVGATVSLRRAGREGLEAAAAAAREALAQRLDAAAGGALVLAAMRDSGKPAVGHNVRFDVAMLLQQLGEPLPPRWKGFKELAARWFPGGLYDTKCLARTGLEGLNALRDTSLGGLYAALGQGGPLQPELAEWMTEQARNVPSPPAWCALPRVAHATGCEAYAGADAAASSHEAGYDAYMTACVFAALLRLHELAGLSQRSRWMAPRAPAAPPAVAAVSALAGRVHVARTRDAQWAALTGPEPRPQRPACFYVGRLPWRTHWGEVQKRFGQAGLGPVRVNMVQGGRAAVVEVLTAAKVPKVLPAIRGGAWQVDIVPYDDYWHGKHGGGEAAAAATGGEGGGGGGGGGAVPARASPAVVAPVGAGAASGAAGSRGALREAAAAAAAAASAAKAAKAAAAAVAAAAPDGSDPTQAAEAAGEDAGEGEAARAAGGAAGPAPPGPAAEVAAPPAARPPPRAPRSLVHSPNSSSGSGSRSGGGGAAAAAVPSAAVAAQRAVQAPPPPPPPQQQQQQQAVVERLARIEEASRRLAQRQGSTRAPAPARPPAVRPSGRRDDLPQ